MYIDQTDTSIHTYKDVHKNMCVCVCVCVKMIIHSYHPK